MMNLFYELERMKHLMNSLLDTPFFWEEARQSRLSYANIYENENGYMIQMLAPGVKKEGVEIHYENEVLTITLKTPEEEKNVQWIRRERLKPIESRSYRLSAEVDPAKIEAKLVDGILLVFLPKREKKEPKKIEVKVK
ncbi:MAG: Hsp20/alpha crystallin family protein [Brevinematales bacterium]|nr:Hsp20/alpha crystallin family protein [Brevinematales bacterium]